MALTHNIISDFSLYKGPFDFMTRVASIKSSQPLLLSCSCFKISVEISYSISSCVVGRDLISRMHLYPDRVERDGAVHELERRGFEKSRGEPT